MRKFCIFSLAFSAFFSACADELVVPTQFPTIQKAVEAAKGGDVVLVKGGTYQGFRVKNGGDSAPLVIRAADGERVVVSGFAPIEGWKDLGGGLFAATTSEPVKELFVGYVEQQCARWPANGIRLPVLSVDHSEHAFAIAPPQGEPLLEEVAKDPKNATVFYLDGFANWFGYLRIASFDVAGGKIKFAAEKRNSRMKQTGNAFSIMNHPALVQKSGDWAFASDGTGGGTLYFRPKSPADLKKTQHRPSKYPLVDVSHWKARPSNVVIEGFEITVAGDVGVKACSDALTLRRCIVHHNAHGGLSVRGAKDLKVLSNVIIANGGNGFSAAFIDGGLIEGNEIGWNLTDGLAVAGDNSGKWKLGMPAATHDIEIRRNYIHHHVLQAHPDNLQFYRGVANAKVCENVFLWGGQSLMAEQADDIEVSGNVVMGCDAIMLICGHGNCNRWRFNGNTLWGAGLGYFSFTGRDYEVAENLFIGGTMPYGEEKAAVRSSSNHFAPSYNGQTAKPWRRYDSIAKAQAEIKQEEGSTEGALALRNFPGSFAVGKADGNATDTVALRGKYDRGGFTVGDKVEINGDGRLRTVKSFDGSRLSFEPALPEPPFRGALVANWGKAANTLIDNRPFANRGSKVSVADFAAGDLLGKGTRTLPTLPPDVSAAIPDPNDVVVPLKES